MATDYFTSQGLSSPQMMARAMKYRNEFDIAFVELVDIVAILEFKLVELYPAFRLLIRRDEDMSEDAVTEPHKDRITVRRSVYRAACEADPEARLVLAHELGHFLLHRDKSAQMHKDRRGAVQRVKKMDATESVEDQADMFARHFLAPPHLAYRYREFPEALASITLIPLRISKGNITMSKRPEVLSVRSIGERQTSLQKHDDRPGCRPLFRHPS